MELGETVCIPNGEPLCEKCPLAELCKGRASGRAGELPVRKVKKKRRVEKRTVFLIRDDEGRVLIRRRPETGLLAGLWEFPSVEGHVKKSQVEESVRRIFFDSISENVPRTDAPAEKVPGGGMAVDIRRLPAAKHIFSHIEWDMIGYEVRIAPHHIVGELWADPHDLVEKYALPTAFSAYLRLV